MSTTVAIRVAINVGGKPRSVLSINEKTDGGLNLHLKFAKYSRNDQTKNKITGEFLTNKYSLHRSAADSKGNTFHLTVRTSNQRPDEKASAYHYTRAIKTRMRFAPVFLRRVPALDSPEFSLTPANRQMLSLGTMQPKEKTLFIAIAVGPTGRKLKREDPLKQIYHLQHHFSFFSLIVFWWFLDIPSHYTGDAIHPITSKDTDGLTPDEIEATTQLMGGFNDIEIVAFMSKQGEMLAKKYIAFLKAHEPLGKHLTASQKLLEPIIGPPIIAGPQLHPIDIDLIRRITRGE
jgi:hypothetical protein